MGDGSSERDDAKQTALKQPGVTDLRACCPDDDSSEVNILHEKVNGEYLIELKVVSELVSLHCRISLS